MTFSKQVCAILFICSSKFQSSFSTLLWNIYTGWVELFFSTIARVPICHFQVQTAAPHCFFVTPVDAVKQAARQYRLCFTVACLINELSLFFFVLLKDYSTLCVCESSNTWRWIKTETKTFDQLVCCLEIAVRLLYLSLIKEGKSLRGNQTTYTIANTHRMDSSSNIWPTKLRVMWKYAEKSPAEKTNTKLLKGETETYNDIVKHFQK